MCRPNDVPRRARRSLHVHRYGVALADAHVHHLSQSGGARHGLTMVELILALAISTLIAGMMAAMSKAVYDGWEAGGSMSEAFVQARAAMARIRKRVGGASATPEDPGTLILPGASGNPDTLVVWADDTDDDGLPNKSELVIYTPSSSDPQSFLEVVQENYPLVWNTTIRFSDVDVATQIAELVSSPYAVAAPLMDRFEAAWVEVEEYPSAEGMPDLAQRNLVIQMELRTTNPGQVGAAAGRMSFFGSAALRYAKPAA